MDAVRIIYGQDIPAMASQLTRDSGALDGLRSSDKVVIKPNLVVSRKDWEGVDTNPLLVESLIVELKQRGVSRITVADGSGMGYSAAKAFRICGYDRFEKRYGVKLVDLEQDTFGVREPTLPGPFERLEIARTALDCDFLINTPVLKAHSSALLTCSLKNLKGTMPRKLKTAFHGVDLNRAIAQLASAIRPDLIVVDGIKGDLSSESGGNPVTMNRMMLGTDPVAVDSVAADMLGYQPHDIRHIKYCAEHGLGISDLDSIPLKPLNAPEDDRKFKASPGYSGRFPCAVFAQGACCTCLGNTMFALQRLSEKGLLNRRQAFVLGQNPERPEGTYETVVSVGRCAAEVIEGDINIDACPPSAHGILKRVVKALGSA